MKENEDEIYLLDMGRILWREWKWLAAVWLAVLVVTFAATHVLRPQWQADAWVQVGELGVAPSNRDPKLEPFQRVLKRIDTRMFQDQVVASLKLGPDAPAAALYHRSLRLDPQPYANLIHFTVRGYSRAQAQQMAAATVAQLQRLHRGFGTVSLQLAQQHLRQVGQALDHARADRRALLKDRPATVSADAGHGTVDKLLVDMQVAQKDTAIRDLQAQQYDLKTRLDTRYTYPTSMPWPIYVPKSRAYPNGKLAWGLGVLAGAFLGTLAAVARHALRRRVSSPAS